MGNFYVIELVNPNGEVGYVIQNPDGISLAVGGLTASVTQFKTYEKAERFVKKIKSMIRQEKMKAFIRSSDYLMEEKVQGIFSADKDMFYLEDEHGGKCFYDTYKQEYYFENREAGFCVWESEEDAEGFINQAELGEKIVIKKIEPEK